MNFRPTEIKPVLSTVPYLDMKSAQDRQLVNKWANATINARDLIHVELEDSKNMEKTMFAEGPRIDVSLLNRPCLDEFDLEIPGCDGHMFFEVKYRRSLIAGEKRTVHYQSFKSFVEAEPMIDMYITLYGNRGINLVVTLFKTDVYSESGNYLMDGISHQLVYRDSVIADLCKKERGYESDLALLINMGKNLYLAVQHSLRHRPTIFVDATGSHIRAGKHESAITPYRKTKVVRKIVIDRTGTSVTEITHFEMQCPCWGVVGHWREYKSGKRVWIKPYKKGKQRNNPSEYSPKEYQI